MRKYIDIINESQAPQVLEETELEEGKAAAAISAAALALASPAAANANDADAAPAPTEQTQQASEQTELSRGMLSQVQWEAEKNIKYRRDRNDADRWEEAGKRGDCEDIAIWKYNKLIELGWPADDLKITTVYKDGTTAMYKGQRVIEMHVVLVVKSMNLVLDSQHSKIVVDFSRWLSDYDYEVFCEVGDHTTPEKSIFKRCATKPPKIT